jgi:hypothetical protein
VSLRRVLVVACAGAALASPASAAAAPTWHEVPMPVPAGGLFGTPVGLPGDLSFWAPNRGLMTVGGNNSVPEGIYSWDGAEWHQLSTVCGGAGDARIAWAGPDEFWTIARPSLPRTQLPGLGLCHFRDGAVVGSYSAPEASPDPYHEMDAAACLAPDNCWFGGVAGKDGSGQRVGAFHLHWNGTELRTVYGPQGRAVSDLLAQGGQLIESTLVGKEVGNHENPDLADPEAQPRLIHAVGGETFTNDPFVPADDADGGTELRALDGDAQTAWAVGGGAVSGPALPAGSGFFERPPLAARLVNGAWAELDPLTLTWPAEGPVERAIFADVAAVPGTNTAWAVVKPGDVFGEADSGQPFVARITPGSGGAGTANVEALQAQGQPAKGTAWRIACPTVADCWMATSRGYLYRWYDDAAVPAYQRDADPAFQGTITVRPNEAAEQTVPDEPPEDDSLSLAPPVDQDSGDDSDLPECKPLRSLVFKIKARARGRSHLVVQFRLRSAAKVGIVAKRGGRVVARSKARRLRAGRHAITLRVSTKRWPKKLSFKVSGDKRKRKPCRGGSGGGGGKGNNDNTVTTRARAADVR